MPDCVFDVVAVDGLVQFELPLAVFVAASVIKRNAALPKLRRLIGRQINKLVEVSSRFSDATEFEIFRCPMVIGQRGGRVQRQCLVEIFDRLLRLLNLRIKSAPHVVGLGVLRFDLDGPARQLDRLLPVSLREGNAGTVEQFIRAFRIGLRSASPQARPAANQGADGKHEGQTRKVFHRHWLYRPAFGRKRFGRPTGSIETPKTKLQTPKKSQVPGSKPQPALRAWNLELGGSLVLVFGALIGFL